MLIELGSDNVLRLDKLRDAESLAYINDAAVTYVLKTLSGVVIDSGTLLYVASSDGRYEAIIPATVTITLRNYGEYLTEVTALSNSTGNTLFKRDITQVVYGT